MHCSCCKEILREIFPDIFICWTLILLCPLLGSKVYQTNTRCQHDFLLTTSGFFLLLFCCCCCCCCGFLVFCFVFHGVFWFKISIWLIFFLKKLLLRKTNNLNNYTKSTKRSMWWKSTAGVGTIFWTVITGKP